jgi:predicted enzyme related to lactoylglutathione lyase
MPLVADSIRIFVTDLAEARRFYGSCLALPLLTEALDQGYLVYQAGPCNLIIEALDPTYAQANGLLGRFVGLSFRVDDIETTYEQLRRRGVEFHSEPSQRAAGGSFAHFYDPDRNILTLVGSVVPS